MLVGMDAYHGKGTKILPPPIFLPPSSQGEYFYSDIYFL
jgi:hypothetical protein